MTEEVIDPSTVEYEAGNYSPQLIRPSDLPPDTIVFDADDDIKRLEFARHQIIVTGQLQVSLFYIIILLHNNTHSGLSVALNFLSQMHCIYIIAVQNERWF